IAKVFKQTAAKLIAAVLRDNVDRTSTDSAKLGAVTAAVDLKFLNGFLADGRAYTVIGDVIVIDTVDCHVIGSTVLTREGESRSRQLRKQRIRDGRTLFDDTGREQRKFQKIPAVDRQFLNRPLSHRVCLMSALCLDHWRRGSHFDFVSDPAHLQVEIDDQA